MTIEMTSNISGTKSSMDIDISENQFYRVRNRFETGELIQEIVPGLSNQEREFLISGMTAEEQELMFCPPDDLD